MQEEDEDDAGDGEADDEGETGDRGGFNSWDGLKCWIDEKIDEKLGTIGGTTGGRGKGSGRKGSAKEASVSPAQHKMILVSKLRTILPKLIARVAICS
jgi:hypothetical protein